MATKIFKLVDQHECSLAKNSGLVGLCNPNAFKIDVTEQGHSIPQFGHAIVDKVDAVAQALIDDGRLKIDSRHVSGGGSAPAKKSASKKKTEDVPTENETEVTEEVAEVEAEKQTENMASEESADSEESGNL